MIDTRERLAMIARGEKPPPRTPSYNPSSDIIGKAFDLIERCATAGARAPFNDDIPGGSRAVVILAERGVLRIEVYAQNWRVIEIRKGEHTGARTMEPPGGGRPYRIIGGAWSRD